MRRARSRRARGNGAREHGREAGVTMAISGDHAQVHVAGQAAEAPGQPVGFDDGRGDMRRRRTVAAERTVAAWRAGRPPLRDG
ncbi:hypothetical protein DF133_14880 [Burkholderia cenocepacia]|nr:hypothetical protein DF133_14880 [Burkholderia cenocepacia]